MFPTRSGTRRTTPALISGKVAPSRIDCGRIISAASVHFASECAIPGPSSGKIDSYARCVVHTNTSWKTRPSTPTTSST